MSQSVVTVRLNGQPYQMGCGPGEESHIEALAKEVDDIITAVKADAGQLGDTRLLAMVALILADQKHTLQNSRVKSSVKMFRVKMVQEKKLLRIKTPGRALMMPQKPCLLRSWMLWR